MAERIRARSLRVPRPLTDEEWVRMRPQNRCEAPCCTARGIRRVPDGIDLDCQPVPGLREVLCLCARHYRALADRSAVACWGRPPLNVVWRMGTADFATWYRNERRLAPAEVEQWMKTPDARFT